MLSRIFRQSSLNKYTYDTYNRVATKSIDEDFAKAGFEKVETYGYNAAGHHILTQTDNLGDNIAVNQSRKFERDMFNRLVAERAYQADGTLVTKYVNTLDQYDNETIVTQYSTEQKISSIETNTYDQFGRVLTRREDQNGNGLFDSKDRKLVRTYSDDSKELITRLLVTGIEGGKEVTKDYNYVYDEKDIKRYEFIDLNNNQKADDNEVVTHVSYVGDTGYIDKFEYGYGLDRAKIYADWKFVFPDAAAGGGEHIAGIRTEVEPAQSYILYGVHGRIYSTKDDYTTGNWAKLLEAYKGKIHVVNLTNEQASTEITIDKQVIANLAPGKEFTIFGDSTDTVNLKNKADFTPKSGTVQIGGQEFEQYTTEVDGQTYTLRIDTDINVVLA